MRTSKDRAWGAPMPCLYVACLAVTDLAVERQKRHMAGLLHCGSHQALVLCTGPGLAARTDLAILGHILAQQVCAFVVDDNGLVIAELAYLRFCEKLAIPAAFAPCLTSFATVWRSTNPPAGVVNTMLNRSPS